MPYERPTEVPYGNRIVTEIVSRDAFNGIEKRAGKIRVNRDHSWDKVVGKIVALHPSRKEGLVTEVKMFKTVIGEETLTLCDEGGLDASAGFALLRATTAASGTTPKCGNATAPSAGSTGSTSTISRSSPTPPTRTRPCSASGTPLRAHRSRSPATGPRTWTVSRTCS